MTLHFCTIILESKHYIGLPHSSSELRLIRTAGAIILQLAYGYKIEPEGSDHLIKLVEEVMEEFMWAITPGAWAVDVISICRHSLPSYSSIRI